MVLAALSGRPAENPSVWKAAGFDAYLVKPARLGAIEGLMTIPTTPG